MKVFIVYNPRSGRGTDIAPFSDALKLLDHDVTTHVLKEGDSLNDLLSGTDLECVVAAGGDGTVSGVASVLSGRGIPMLAYPAGTANLVALNLNLPSKPADLVAVVIGGRTVDIDLGHLTLNGKDGQPFEHDFILNAGVGYDAALIRSSEPLKDRFGFAAYIAAAITNARPKVAQFEVTIDGERHDLEGIGVMLVNLPRLPLDLPLVQGGSPTDGMLDVVVMRAHTAAQLVPDLAKAALERLGLGNAAPPGCLEVLSGAEISINCSEALPVQFDGETTPASTPLKARIFPRAVPFLVSRTDGRD